MRMRRAVVITIVGLLALTALACSQPEPDPNVARNAAAIRALEEVFGDFRAEVRHQAEEQEANLQQALADQMEAVAALQEEKTADHTAELRKARGHSPYDDFSGRLTALEDSVKELHQYMDPMMGIPDEDLAGMMEWDPEAMDARIAELATMPQRLTEETATADQATVVNAARDCLSQGGLDVPDEKIAKLMWAEAGASKTDRDLVEQLVEQCSGPIMMQVMMGSILGMGSGQNLFPSGSLSSEDPLVVRLVGCLTAEHIEGVDDPADVASLYLNLIPAESREAAVNLYCGDMQ